MNERTAIKKKGRFIKKNDPLKPVCESASEVWKLAKNLGMGKVGSRKFTKNLATKAGTPNLHINRLSEISNIGTEKIL